MDTQFLDYVARIGHDLRSPLNSILGFAELIADGLSGPVTDKQKRHLGIITRNGHELLAMIDEVVYYAKVESGAITHAPHPVETTAFFDALRSTFEDAARERGHSLQIETVDLPTTLTFDDHKLTVVLHQLIGNAIRYTNEGEIRIVARCVEPDLNADQDADTPGEHALVVTVADTGPGLPPPICENLDAERGPLYRSNQGRSSGIGLGLALAASFCKCMGASLTYQTCPAIEGTIFTVRVPVAETGN